MDVTRSGSSSGSNSKSGSPVDDNMHTPEQTGGSSSVATAQTPMKPTARGILKGKEVTVAKEQPGRKDFDLDVYRAKLKINGGDTEDPQSKKIERAVQPLQLTISDVLNNCSKKLDEVTNDIAGIDLGKLSEKNKDLVGKSVAQEPKALREFRIGVLQIEGDLDSIKTTGEAVERKLRTAQETLKSFFAGLRDVTKEYNTLKERAEPAKTEKRETPVEKPAERKEVTIQKTTNVFEQYQPYSTFVLAAGAALITAWTESPLTVTAISIGAVVCYALWNNFQAAPSVAANR